MQNPPQEGGGLNSGLQQGPAGAFHVPGPHIPNQETLSSLGAPLVRLFTLMLRSDLVAD